ncbi:hypothetical protein [Arthrobacter cavernae]|uniref:Uncharacterized protein n=1 Tax=Arthrobacter cavernae TaxID=2817681 RepID=A0A939HDC1_9MICC|nr:hypothetical protein [Arthrobacter cavernae]MBO1267094.1 hypothetical protein [Arthrobacter cavernae]
MGWIEDLNGKQDMGGGESRLGWNRYAQQQFEDQRRKLQDAQDKKPKGNFLTSLLPTGGGIAGTLGGAAAGAAAGSVVPILGTAVGGLLGAILGGAGGSALGKVGENAVTGEEDLGKGVGEEALMGGLTSLPIGAGFKLARAGAKVATGLGKKSAGDLVQEAGVSTIGKGSVSRMASNGNLDQSALDAVTRLQGGKVGAEAASKFGTTGKLKNMGDQALLSQYGTISKPIARQTNPTQTISTLADAGIIKPTDAERVASGITGSSGIVNQAVAKAVDGAGYVDTGTLRRVFQDGLDNHGLVEKDRKSLMTMFDAQMNKMSGGARGSLNPKVNPTDALSSMRSIEERIANLQGKGGNYSLPTPERIDQANVLKLVRDEMQDQIYTGAGANANLSGVLTPKLREDLAALMPNNAKWQQYIDNNIMNATDVGQLRSAQAPFVRAGKIIDEGDINALTFGGRGGNAFASGGFKDMLGTAATNLVKDPAARASGRVLRTAGGAGGARGGQVGQSLLGAGIRQGGGRVLLNGQEQQPLDTTDQEIATLEQALLQSDGGGGVPGLHDSPSGNIDSWDPNDPTAINPPPSNPFGVSRDEVGQALVRAMQANDKTAVSQLQDLYSMVDDYETQQGATDLNATTQKALAQSSNADSTLSQLESLLGQVGGSGGPLAGRFSSFMGDIGMNNDVKTYNDLAAGSITQIAKALGETGAMSDSDRIAYSALLPKVTDTPEVAANKFAALRARMASAHQNTLQYGAGVDPTLEQALLGGGY